MQKGERIILGIDPGTNLMGYGLLKVVDAETGHEMYIDTSSKKLRRAHAQYWHHRQQMLTEAFTKSNVDHISIATTDDYVKMLMQLFRLRSER